MHHVFCNVSLLLKLWWDFGVFSLCSCFASLAPFRLELLIGNLTSEATIGFVSRYLRVIQVRSTTSFGGEVKLLVPCCRFMACKESCFIFNPRRWKVTHFNISKSKAHINNIYKFGSHLQDNTYLHNNNQLFNDALEIIAVYSKNQMNPIYTLCE
jgi:hypothetical protein